MRLPWRRQPIPEERSSIVTDAELDTARQARVQSTREFLNAVDKNVEVRKHVETLRDRRTLNHFGELLEQSMRFPWKDHP